MARKKTGHDRIEPSFEDDDGGSAPSRKRRKPSGASRDAVKSNKGGTATRGSAGRRKRSSPRRRRGMTALVRRAFYWSFVLGIWGVIAIGAVITYYGARMPSASTWAIPDRPPNVRIVSVSDKLLANRGATGGEALPLSRMSPYIPEAVIAIEDRRFYWHFGVDPIGLTRAVVTNLVKGRTVQGGSTLSQQLAKNLFLSPERTVERKVQEVLLAFWLEHKFSKDQILEMYLNRVYFGSGAYGVAAAARRYFGKSAADVTLSEAAILAGLLKAPSRLSPARDPQAAEARAQVVLAAMQRAGFISDRETATALTAPPVRAKSYWTGSENFVADLVMKRLPELIGEVRHDVVVETTIDLHLQQSAENQIRTALKANGPEHNVTEGALVAIDGTGAVRAMIGGRDYADSQYNRAALAKRQPGSAFKPFVYAAALEAGRTPNSVRYDAPVKIGKWTPENYDQKYRGEVTLATALKTSLNTVAAQLVMEAGPGNVVKTAHRLGIESDLKANASIALGTSEVTLTELTAAYAPFMNGGFKATPHVIRRVRSLDGEVLFENSYTNPPRVLTPNVTAMMNQMLVGVIEDGTGKRARLSGWQAAGKTGTTNSYRDALFVGYTANLATGVWFGNDDGTPMKDVTGGSLPAETWQAFMAAAHAGLDPAPLPHYRPLPASGQSENRVAAGRQLESSFPAPPTAPAASGGNPRPPAAVAGGAGQRTTLLDLILGN
ncbi:transglycosylase domain-containing protein [Pseudohoeflea coraliihabitans]|uniref:Penicillin-binding protein n=1 Tax=Pseudohoeflea coraliihabitans TaxID=2860393 RepID=A0ABS6WSY1_9HYPH|nr:transglycosylase domain-containing protein [Pseudohoeflea sp. DP4N28-3]MBW3099077.1 penicillin-binding protein [Pseudohoeflea sp. DP4N28-3]